LCFFIILWFPLLYAPAAFPNKELAAGLLTKAGGAFEAAFPFRVQARSQFNELKYWLFRTWAPQFLEGRKGWIFYRGEIVNDGQVLNDFLGEIQPTSSTVNTWCSNLAKRHAWLKAHGATSITLIVPNKETIYADMLPDNLSRKRGRTRLDALTSACPDEVLDLREPLSAARRERDVYYSAGTHWASQGAYVGYTAIIDTLVKYGWSMTPLPRSAFRERLVDLAADSFVPGWARIPPENELRLDPIEPYPACYQTTQECKPMLFPGWVLIQEQAYTRKNYRGLVLVSQHPDSRLPSAVVFHDSFLRFWLQPMLAQHFRRIVFVRYGFDPAVVEEEKPDVVIVQAAERYLSGLVDYAISDAPIK
jgi:alginate O-acetyltransferase complex protein AlgJ